MNNTVLQQLTRARTALILDQPFFGVLALRLQLIEDNNHKTLAVNGRQVFYNANFVASLTPALTKSALAHEVFHCVYDHISRRGSRNPRKYNMAGDYVINAALKDSGFEIGDGWLYNSAYAGMSSDEIYNLIPDNDNKNDEGPLDEILDGDPSETEIEATDWKIATIQAAGAAKAMGKLPASLQRFIDELTIPKIDWKSALQRFVTETSKNDYSWLRPNRRFVAQGMFLPTLYSEAMGEIVVAIDTSGSIDQATLNTFGAEVKAIVQSVRPSTTHVVYCDAAINHVDTFEPNDELKFEMYGGDGGTDFCPPFEYVTKHDVKPVCMVYLTDGYGPFPKTPDYPVLWICTSDVVAPFGETVAIEI